MASSFSSSSSIPVVKLHSPRVFVNFRGDELRNNIISHLETALIESEIDFFIDNQIVPGDDIETLFKEIENSEIALVFFSERYPQSNWCLNELVKIMEEVQNKNFKVIPIFYKVKVDDVKHFTGKFGENLHKGDRPEIHRMPDWKKALKSAAAKLGLESAKYSTEREFIVKIIQTVKKVQTQHSTVIEGKGTNNGTTISLVSRSDELPIIDERVKQLEEKLYDFNFSELRIVGIIGMSGIGKTTLAQNYYERYKKKKFLFNECIPGICEKSREHGSDWLKDRLLKGEGSDAEMFTKKIFVVLDDVSHKDQVHFLLENRARIHAGSKIVITTRDKSSIEELVDDIYVVPRLHDREAFQLFNDHAGGNFPELSKKFVEYAEGNPRTLMELGKELFGKDKGHWKTRQETLPHCCNRNILTELKISYDKLSDDQKDAFLDIACFFRSEEEDYVKCLLADVLVSGDAVKDLVDKCLIRISAGRIEMDNVLSTLGRELGTSNESKSGERMWNHDKIIETLCLIRAEKGTYKVRGVFLDTSQIKVKDGENDIKEKKEIALDKDKFIKRLNQENLRYLKIYDSLCSQECVEGKVNLPEGLEFPFPEIRYLHWLRFPLNELPSDFNPKNLIDLRLPYSKIGRVWEAAKEAPQLRWVDLSFSTMLVDLSALSKAVYLRRVNLEGCTNLKELPREMGNMKNLIFINLRGCVMLSSLPAKLHSLKTLILSGCSKFAKFELNSENLEFLHLDGTAIKNLPKIIQKFQKLVLLNLKECRMLESLPYCLYKLKALEELILSGCILLRSFPDIRENMENLQILLLDGTSIEEVPNALLHAVKFEEQVVCQLPLRMNGVSLLRRLSLSRNEKICSLGFNISQLYHLKWLDLKYCKNLLSISTLPPNLQCLDAHDCISLKTVASPLALLMPTTQQVPTSFIFTNCEKLEHDVENDIVCCAHNKSLLLSEALNRQNKGVPFEALVVTCFPGSEVPAWFSHRASGAELKPELPAHWRNSGFVGIALCAVVSFKNYKTRSNDLHLKCRCEFNDVETSSSNITCHIGGLADTGDEERTIKSTHVLVCYTNWLEIKRCQEEDGKKCVPTKASIEFKVIDGTDEVMNCEVLYCGFSLVYKSGSWEASSETECVVTQGGIFSGFLRGIKSAIW